MKITIDGPSGAGKSTISKYIAKKLNYVYIDTGAMYRAVGFYCIKNKIEYSEAEKYINLINISINKDQQIYLNNQNVTDEIRTPEASMAASSVSALPMIRKKMVELQRFLANNCNVVMDGRDAGTFVLPNAEIKFFLTASPEARAERRLKDFELKKIKIDYKEVLEDIKKRDKNDSERVCSPLRMADDAILVDTTNLNFEQSVTEILNIISSRM